MEAKPLPVDVQDMIRQHSAHAWRQVGRNMHVAGALGKHPPEVSHRRTGNPAKRDPLAELLGEAWRLEVTPGPQSSAPIIAKMRVIQEHALMAYSDVQTLLARLERVNREEFDAEQKKHRLVRDGAGLLAVSDAQEEQAAKLIELAAVNRALAAHPDYTDGDE